MLHTWTTNIRYDKYCNTFLEVRVQLNKLKNPSDLGERDAPVAVKAPWF